MHTFFLKISKELIHCFYTKIHKKTYLIKYFIIPDLTTYIIQYKLFFVYHIFNINC